MSKVIFAIDNGADLHTRAKFLRHLDTLRAMGKLQGEARLCIGRWVDDEGNVFMENSYCMDADDYEAHVSKPGWTNAQQCVLLLVSSGGYGSMSAGSAAFMPPDLRDRMPKPDEIAGIFHPIKDPSGHSAWTMFEDTGGFWTIS